MGSPLYGRDYADRLRTAGFQLTIDAFVRRLPESEVRRCGLIPHGDVYYCEKPDRS